ncbi:hypothetical protein Tco_1306089, partial [Tanacetum coccineum]
DKSLKFEHSASSILGADPEEELGDVEGPKEKLEVS